MYLQSVAILAEATLVPGLRLVWPSPCAMAVAGQPGAVLAPHRDRVSLLRDPWSGVWTLFHESTGERAPLPSQADGAELLYDEQ